MESASSSILWFLVTPGVVGLLLLLALQVELGVVAAGVRPLLASWAAATSETSAATAAASRFGLLGLRMFSKVKTRTSASFSDDGEEERDGGEEPLVDELYSE